MKLFKTMLVTLLLAGGAGLLSACGGADEPSTKPAPALAATATPERQADPTPGVTQPPTPTATASPTPPSVPSSKQPNAPSDTAEATPTPPPTVAATATTVPTATFTPVPPTITPVPTDTPSSCSRSNPALSGSAGRVAIELSGNSIGRFRVREQFARVSLPNDAVGTTREVSGSVVFDGSGTVLPGESKITVGLLSLISDEDERDEFLRTNSLQSEKFPLAELVVRETPGLPWPILCQGEMEIQLVGDMTVHGVTSQLTWNATVQFSPNAVKGLMKTNFPFSTFDMKKPKKLFLLSVDDNIRLELQFDAPIVAGP